VVACGNIAQNDVRNLNDKSRGHNECDSDLSSSEVVLKNIHSHPDFLLEFFLSFSLYELRRRRLMNCAS
jgi:hypothetical protein